MKRTAKFLAMLLAILMLATSLPVFAAAETNSEDVYHELDFANYGEARVNENVTVFEFKLPRYTGNVDKDGYAAFSLIQNCGGEEYILDLITVDKITGNLVIGANGQYFNLFSRVGTAITVRETPISVAIVYDDTNGTARYFVGNSLAYVMVDDQLVAAANLPVFDTEFATREYVQYTKFRLFERGANTDVAIDKEAYEFNAYNVNLGDTARIVGFQENDVTDQLRILAGVDSLYYDEIGFEIETFVGGVSKGKTEISENIVFSSVSANDKMIDAESFGHRYLAAAEITALPRPILENSYLTVRAYTEIDGVKRYDDAINVAVCTDENNKLRYFFDNQGFIYTNTFDGLTEVPSEWKFISSESKAGVSVVDSGKLRFTEYAHNGGAYIYLDQYVGRDFLIQTDITITDKVADISYLAMLFGYKNETNHDLALFRFNGQGCIQEKVNDTGIDFPGTRIDQANVKFSLELNKTYTFTLICQGDKASFFVDGEIIAEGVYVGSKRTSTDKVGFMSKGLTYEIDNFMVRTLDDIVSDVIYTDDFENADTSSADWIEMTAAGGTKTLEESTILSVENGKLNFVNLTNSYTKAILNKDLGTGEYVVQADVKIKEKVDSTGYVGLILRHSSNKKFIVAGLRINGEGWIEARSNDAWSTFENIDYKANPIFKLSTDEEEHVYTLTAICKGETIYFYINGTLIGEGNFDDLPETKAPLDEDYLLGQVGFYVKGLNVEVDNYSVKALNTIYNDYAVYEEDFDSYISLPDGWKTTASVANSISYVSLTPSGKLNIVEPKGNWFITYLDKDIELKNYEYSADITINEYEKGVNGRYFGLVFGYRDVKNFAIAELRVNGEGAVGIMRYNGASLGDSAAYNLVEDAGITPTVGKTYTLTVRVINNVATLYVNNNELATYNLGDKLLGGKIGIIASGVTIDVDNVKITEIKLADPSYDLYKDNSVTMNCATDLTSIFDSGGSANITNGKLVTTYGATDQYVHNFFEVKDENGNYLGYNETTGTNDYEVLATFTVDKIADTWKYICLSLRIKDKDTRIEAAFRINGKNGEGQGWIEFKGVSGTNVGFDLADTYGKELVLGQTYVLKGVCQGNTVTLYLDDVQLATATIPEALNTGYAGLSSKGINYSLDSFVMTEVGNNKNVLYKNDFDWTTVGLSTKNTLTVNEDGKFKFTATEFAYFRSYFNRDIGYSTETLTNNYTVEATVKLDGYVTPTATSNPNFGLYLRQGPDTDNDKNYEEHKSYVYCAIRPNTGYMWIQGNNTSGSGLNVNGGNTPLTVGATYTIRATFYGDHMTCTVLQKNTSANTDTVIKTVTVNNPKDGLFDKGIVGIASYGSSITIEDFVVIPNYDSETEYFNLYDGRSGEEALALVKGYEDASKKCLSVTDDGKVKHVGGHSTDGRRNYYFDSNLGYNHETGTNDYSIEMQVTMLDDEGSYFGILFRSTSSSKFIYAGLRTNDDYSFVQVDNVVNACNKFKLNHMGYDLAKDKTYTVKLNCEGDYFTLYINNVLIARGTIPDAYKMGSSNNRSTGMVGFVQRGADMTIDSYIVRPIYKELTKGDTLYFEDFSEGANFPAEWSEEVGARRTSGAVAKLTVGANANNTANGQLIVSARGSAHTVIALDKAIEGGFVYEADLTMLFQDNFDGVSYKMGPVFGLQDDSTSVSVTTRIGGSTTADVEAWLIKKPNAYYESDWKNFGSFNVKTSVGTAYKYKLVGTDGYITVYIDGAQVFRCAVDDPFLDGRFGFMFRNAVVSLDNVKLQRYLPDYTIPQSAKAIAPTTLRVATFNIGDFSTASGSANIGISKGNGTEATKAEYIAAFGEVDAAIWGLQEDSQYFNGNTQESAKDAIYDEIHPYHQGNFTGGYNGKAFISGYELYDVKAVKYGKAYDAEVYPDGTTSYGHPWFLTGKVMINDREVTLVTMHFDWECKIRRAQQIEDILNYVEGLEYVIVLGDVNPDDKVNGEVTGSYVNDRDNQYFIDAGFTVANGGEFGLFYTTMTKGAPRNTNNPCDNIYTSSKIKMVNAQPIYKSWMSDHAIVIADIEIY